MYKKAPESLVIACPHSGLSFKGVSNRDEFTETVAGFVWNKLGGNLVVSTIPRSRAWGVDFNRSIPPRKEALAFHKTVKADRETGAVIEFMKKYGWTAENDEDYDQRLQCYQSFWGEVSVGKDILLIHRQHTRLKNVPSLMDVTTFGSVKKSTVDNAVRKVNKKFAKFLLETQYDYRRMLAAESKRRLLMYLKTYNTVNPEKIGKYKRFFEQDLNVAKKYADKIALNRLKLNFTAETVFETMENALHHLPPPAVTHEHYKYESSHGPVRKLFPKDGRRVIQIECSSFLLYWHPVIASEMIAKLYQLIMN